MFLRSTILLMLMAGPAVAAHAPPAPPRYDVDRMCAFAARGQALVKNRCIDQEQFWFDYVRDVWPELSEESRAICRNHSDGAKAWAYTMLGSCIRPRLRMERLARPHRFRYDGGSQ